MPAPLYAPRVSETEQRRARLENILSQFGIDVAKLDECLRNPLVNAGTPMEQARAFFVPYNPQDKGEVAASLAGAVVGGNYSIANRCRGKGISAFCASEEEAMRFLGAVLRAYSGIEGRQAISEDTQRWLRSPEFALSATVLSGMSKSMREKWFEENFDNFMSAAIFQAWAKAKGIGQPTIDEAGRAVFGELWDYASPVGLHMQQREDGTWYLRGGSEGTALVMEALRRLPPVQAPTTLAAVPVRTTPKEVSMEQQFLDFYSRNSERMFSGGIKTVLSYENRDGWLRYYIRTYESGLGREDRFAMQRDLREATAFYVWAKNIAKLDDTRIEEIGSERYGRLWPLARAVGENLRESTERAGVYVLPRETLQNIRVAFGMVEGRESERVALAPVSAGAPRAAARGEFADIAARYGVSEDFLKRAVELIEKHGNVRLSFDMSDRPEAGMDEGMSRGVPWLRYHPPNGQTTHTVDELVAAVKEASELRGITWRRA